MTVEIKIVTEDNNLQLVHAVLADIIAKSAQRVPTSLTEIDRDIYVEDDNCGFDYEATFTRDPEDEEHTTSSNDVWTAEEEENERKNNE